MFAYCGNNPVMYSDPTGCYRKNIMPIYADNGLHYILNQNDESIANLPLGESTIGPNGCGVVATYNALLHMGKFETFENVRKWYCDNVTFVEGHGELGIYVGTICHYFLDHNCLVTVSIDPNKIENFSKSADACILLYYYTSPDGGSGHYIHYSWIGNNYVGFNTSEQSGNASFLSPVSYGYSKTRYLVIGIFITDISK